MRYILVRGGKESELGNVSVHYNGTLLTSLSA